jgi:hypothetical protein
VAPDDWHKHICTGAYLALTVLQSIFVYLLFRSRKQHHEPPPL